MVGCEVGTVIVVVIVMVWRCSMLSECVRRYAYSLAVFCLLALRKAINQMTS